MDTLAIVPDVDGEALDEILTARAVVQGAGAVEQGDRGIDGGLLPAVPGNPQPRAGKRQRRLPGHIQFQGPEHRGRLGYLN